MLSHHAHLVRADVPRDVVLPPFDTAECYDTSLPRFGIDDARELTLQAHTRPRAAEEKIFVLRIDFITLEAQNALLKLFEEPPKTSRFLLLVPPDLPLLDTLLSRVEPLRLDVLPASTEVFDAFLAADLKERMAVIERATKTKDHEWQRSIKSGLIRYLERSPRSRHYRELEFVARSLLTRGASNKMLFEHAALLL